MRSPLRRTSISASEWLPTPTATSTRSACCRHFRSSPCPSGRHRCSSRIRLRLRSPSRPRLLRPRPRRRPILRPTPWRRSLRPRRRSRRPRRRPSSPSSRRLTQRCRRGPRRLRTAVSPKWQRTRKHRSLRARLIGRSAPAPGAPVRHQAPYRTRALSNRRPAVLRSRGSHPPRPPRGRRRSARVRSRPTRRGKPASRSEACPATPLARPRHRRRPWTTGDSRANSSSWRSPGSR